MSFLQRGLRRLHTLGSPGKLRNIGPWIRRLRRIRRWCSRSLVECQIPRCRRFHLAHPWLRRVPGISMGSAWYCGASCLRDGLEREARAQQATAAAATRHPPRMPYRLILLARGVVNEAQLEQARAALSGSRAKGELGETLVRLGFATEEQVALALAAQEGCAFYAAEPEWVPAGLCPPIALMRRYRAVPVHYQASAERLLLGFVHRVEPRLLEAVAQVTGCRVEACVVTPSRYGEQMSRWATEDSGAERRPPLGATGETVAEDSPAAIAALVLAEAVRCGADELSMARLGETLWLRFAGEKRTFDLLVEMVPPEFEDEVRTETTPEPGAGARRSFPESTRNVRAY